MRVLSQTMGTWDGFVAYPLKRLDSVATGWPDCLQAISVVALLVREATKLNLGQDLIIKVLHEVNTLLRVDPHKNGCQYPGLLTIKGCYVRILTSILSLARLYTQPHSCRWERVKLLRTAEKSWKRSMLADWTFETNRFQTLIGSYILMALAR